MAGLSAICSPKAAQELAAGGRHVDRQARLDVGRPRPAKLEHVVQRHQVEVVVRVQVRNGHTSQPLGGNVLRDATGNARAAIDEHGAFALAQKVARACAARVRGSGASTQDR